MTHAHLRRFGLAIAAIVWGASLVLTAQGGAQQAPAAQPPAAQPPAPADSGGRGGRGGQGGPGADDPANAKAD